MRARNLLLTCEHGGNTIPPRYHALFRGRRRRLDSHEGFDIGASGAARFLQRQWHAPLVSARVSRLLVDLNRSSGNRAVFSEVTRTLGPAERSVLLREYYHPYRELVAKWIAIRIGQNESVLHLSVHSFTPVLNGKRRGADIGLLYDPRRQLEQQLCLRWQAALRAEGWRVRRNYPYRGTSDGHITELRRRFGKPAYVGIEIELNQEILEGPLRVSLLWDVARSFETAVDQAIRRASGR